MIAEVNDELLLAGDIGGTKTLLGLFDARAAAAAPRSCARRSARSTIADLPTMIAAFLRRRAARRRRAIGTACFGVAGPVVDEAGEADQRALARRRARSRGAPSRSDRVHLLNDLQAMAYAVRC